MRVYIRRLLYSR